eukprot:TRINITY_DN2412_c0_g1_i1.p1 TRINITY_DN2412_c0_g1~~TRINITY_DN2412_c0_g1_i1.p1  ORF type:complete len:1379 (+),score=482.22 TRINITY_DN2412_c0_g1_i1:221-4357(+)
MSEIRDSEFKFVASNKFLYRLKGKKKIYVRQVDPKPSSINRGDVFVLDAGKRIFVVLGSEASKRKRDKGVFFANALNEEQGLCAEVILLDGKNEDKNQKERFWKALGLRGKVGDATATESDDKEEKIIKSAASLFRISEASGRLEVMAWVGEEFRKEMLDSSSCYVLDCQSLIFVWAGMYSTNEERNWAMLKAEELQTRGSRPECTRVLWVLDGDEILLFRDQFVDWEDLSWDEEVQAKLAREREQREKEEREQSERQRKERAEKRYSSDLSKLRIQTRKREPEALTREGILYQQDGNAWLERFFLLEEGVLRSYKSEDAYIDGLKPFDEITLSQCSFKESENVPLCFELKSPSKLFVLKCDNEVDILLWLNLLLKNKFITSEEVVGRSRASSLPPFLEKPVADKLPEKLPEKPTSIHDVRKKLLQKNKKDEKAKKEEPKQKEEKRSPKEEINKKKEEIKPSKEEFRSPKKTEPTPQKVTVEEEYVIPLEELERRRQERIKNRREREREEKQQTPQEKEPERQLSPRKSATLPMTRREEDPSPAAEFGETSFEELERRRQERVRQKREEDERQRAKSEAEERAAKAAQKERENQSKAVKSPPREKKKEEQKETAREDSKATAASIANITSSTAKLSGPTKAGASAGRRAPTKNPIKDRSAIESQHQQSAGEPSAATKVSKPQVGGYGLLYSLDAEKFLFKAKSTVKKPRNFDEDSYENPRLIQIKGRRNIFVRQVELSVSSLNSGDVFLLDTGKNGPVIYQWNGAQANRIEKGKAMDVAKSIKDKERSGLPRVSVLDEGCESDDFWKALKRTKEEEDLKIASAEEGGEDDVSEKVVWEKVKLSQVITVKNDQYELQEIGASKLYKELLREEFCYILDAFTEVFVWTGKKAPLKVKNESMKLGKKITDGRDFWTAPLARELPGAESVLFKEKFANWGSGLPIQMQQVPVGLNTAAAVKQEKIDVEKMHRPPHEREEVMIDDGRSGKVEIWRVVDNTKVAVAKETHGQFYSSESYLILYTYIWKNKDCYIIYFWQGRNSSILEKGTAALLTIDLDDKLNGMAKEVRVVQNKEPKHFFSVFKGKFVVHLGKDKPKTTSTPSLYQIQGTASWNTHAIEVKCDGTSLNTNSVFVLINGDKSYIWKGSCLKPEELEFAKGITSLDVQNAKIVEEGKEPSDFWKAITGPKQKYILRRPLRLFVCSIGSGAFTVEEVAPFTQDDLLTEDVFILDAFDRVFVWIGKLSDAKEKKMAMETAVEYIESSKDGRDVKSTLNNSFAIYEKQEPLLFTSYFHGWDWTKYGEGFAPEYDNDPPTITDLLKEFNRTYSYEDLVNKTYPKGIDTSKLEELMADEEFEQIFGVSKEGFRKYPIWRQQKEKRERGLF